MSTNNRIPNQHKMKGLFHGVFGFLYLIIAGVIVYAEKNDYIEVGDTFAYIMCVLFVIYGLFRIYRAYRLFTGKQHTW